MVDGDVLNIPEAIFCLLKEDYRLREYLGFRICNWGNLCKTTSGHIQGYKPCCS